jgi:hypothetical protein
MGSKFLDNVAIEILNQYKKYFYLHQKHPREHFPLRVDIHIVGQFLHIIQWRTLVVR